MAARARGVWAAPLSIGRPPAFLANRQGKGDVPQPRVGHDVTFLRLALYTRPIRPKTPQNKPPVHI
eukprot:381805-Prymnesium_polylepis.1